MNRVVSLPMKLLGIVLIAGAVVGGGILLYDSVPSYFNNGALMAKAEKRAEEAIAANDVQAAESELDTIVTFKEVRHRRLMETLVASAGMVVLVGFGVLLFRRGARKATLATT